MSLYALLQNNPSPSLMDCEQVFDGNICRCTGYRPLLDAAKSFAVDNPNHDDQDSDLTALPDSPQPVWAAYTQCSSTKDKIMEYRSASSVSSSSSVGSTAEKEPPAHTHTRDRRHNTSQPDLPLLRFLSHNEDARHQWHHPATLKQALLLRAEFNSDYDPTNPAAYYYGNTDFTSNRRGAVKHLISVQQLSELKYHSYSRADGLTLGAGMLLSQTVTLLKVARRVLHFPNLPNHPLILMFNLMCSYVCLPEPLPRAERPEVGRIK